MRKTVTDIAASKNNAEPIVCLTAYSATMASALDSHVDLLLVGDSVGMVLYGMENTLGVDMEMMIRHGQAVMRGSSSACVIVDMPFGSYEESKAQAYRNAARIMKETGCSGIKLEGGVEMAETIAHLTAHNIPVMGHIGLMPQSVIKEGGYKIKGRNAEQEALLMADARAVEEAGAFSVVIEGTVDDVAARLSESLNIPTIGIGASPACDGQILVSEDMLGLHTGHIPKFVKQYAALHGLVEEAAASYAMEVKSRAFPSDVHLYRRPKLVKDKKEA